MLDDAEKSRRREFLRNPTRRYVTGIVSLVGAIVLATAFWLIRALW